MRLNKRFKAVAAYQPSPVVSTVILMREGNVYITSATSTCRASLPAAPRSDNLLQQPRLVGAADDAAVGLALLRYTPRLESHKGGQTDRAELVCGACCRYCCRTRARLALSGPGLFVVCIKRSALDSFALPLAPIRPRPFLENKKPSLRV